MNKINSFYFDYNLLYIDSFTKLNLNNFEFGVTYSMLVRVEYNDNKYGMAGRQIGFKLNPDSVYWVSLFKDNISLFSLIYFVDKEW